MKIGKVPNDILKEIIIDKIRHTRPEVVLRPGIGEDCSAVDFGENICVLSSDPITGAANEVGRLAVHISCNDIASCGVEPLGLMVTILAPPQTTREDLDGVMNQLTQTAGSINVEIIGGHTEITDAVNRMVLVSTAIGRVPKGRLISTAGAVPGDKLVITKSAGLEGTAIIAHDREEELVKHLGVGIVEKAKNCIADISVIKEGILAGEFGVSAMHDVTEGGILGAVWEMAEASGTGVRINKNLIPVEEETLKICSHYGIDPLKLISSGCMAIACKDGEGLARHLRSNGVPAAVIGEITADSARLLEEAGTVTEISQPGTDELYNVI